jgi:hypothetical protein
MRPETTSDERRDHRVDVGPADEAIEHQLTAALEAAEGRETRFHLRQGLQLLEALKERDR